MPEYAYDHDAYSARLGEAQACLAHHMAEAMSDGLEELVDEIVRKDELCNPDAPEDDLYHATFFLVMVRLLAFEISHHTRTE
jgi:hypothetical protein